MNKEEFESLSDRSSSSTFLRHDIRAPANEWIGIRYGDSNAGC
jgi:hypothetical protein